jgi:hypothetical protein
MIYHLPSVHCGLSPSVRGAVGYRPLSMSSGTNHVIYCFISVADGGPLRISIKLQKSKINLQNEIVVTRSVPDYPVIGGMATSIYTLRPL